MYDELAIVVGKDTVTGSFSKSYVDIENELDNRDSIEFVADNGEEGVVDKGKNAIESFTTGSEISKSRKRGRAPPSDDSVLTDLSDQLKEIGVALKEINRGLLITQLFTLRSWLWWRMGIVKTCSQLPLTISMKIRRQHGDF